MDRILSLGPAMREHRSRVLRQQTPWHESVRGISDESAVNPIFSVDDEGYYVIEETGRGVVVRERDRRRATAELLRKYPDLEVLPPSDAEWPRDTVCAAAMGIIDPANYRDGYRRRVLPQRDPDLWFNPCSANTHYGLGWFTMPGFVPAPVSSPEPGCAPPVLYMSRGRE